MIGAGLNGSRGLPDAKAIAQALPGLARRSGKGWQACCPAHDDHRPSLQIDDGDTGPLVICRAGCSQGDVLAALRTAGIWPGGSTGTERGPQPARKAKPRPAAPTWLPMTPPPADAPQPPDDAWHAFGAVHDYRGTDGRLLFYVRRREATRAERKQFIPLCFGVLDGVTGWHAREPAAPRPLFNLDQLAARPDAPAIICEGEKAAGAAALLFSDAVATTWPGGAARVAGVDWSPLLGRDALIWPDADEPGLRAAAQIAAILPHAKVLDVAGLPPGFDAADLDVADPFAWIQARLPPDVEPEAEAEPEQPRDEPPPNEQPRDEAEPGKQARGDDETQRRPRILLRHPALVDDEAKIPRRRWVGGPGAFPRSKLSIIAGAPGVLKTTAALTVGIALAAGKEYAGLVEAGEPQKVLIFCIEDDIEEMQRRAHAIAAYLCGSEAERATINSNLHLVDIAEHVPLFQITSNGDLVETEGAADVLATIAEIKPALTVLDPYAELHTAAENENAAMRPVNSRLRSWARTFDTALCVLAHETKAGEGTALQRLRGAGSIGGAIRGLWSMRRMTVEEARNYSVSDDLADLYVKVESGKTQYTRKRSDRWLVIEERDLKNGETAGALLPWSPPTVTITIEMQELARLAIRRGVKIGDGYEPACESGRSHAFYVRAFEAAEIPKAAAAKLLDRLLASGEVTPRAWRDPEARKDRVRLWTAGNTFEGWRNAAP